MHIHMNVFLHGALFIHLKPILAHLYLFVLLHGGRAMTNLQPSLLQLSSSPQPPVSFPPSSVLPFKLIHPGEASLQQFLQLRQLSGQTYTYTRVHKHTRMCAHIHADIRTHMLSQVAGQSRAVPASSIPDGKAVLSVYLAPGHPRDSLSAFSPLPKTCSSVYLLIDSQRKAKIDSAAPTSLKSFLAKQTRHAITS